MRRETNIICCLMVKESVDPDEAIFIKKDENLGNVWSGPRDGQQRYVSKINILTEPRFWFSVLKK